MATKFKRKEKSLDDLIQHNYKDEQVDDLTGIIIRRKAIVLKDDFIDRTKNLTLEEILSIYSKFNMLNYISF